MGAVTRVVSPLVVLAAACGAPAPLHIGAPTPTPVDEDPHTVEQRKFPKGDLHARYELAQRDRCGARCRYLRDGAARLRLDLRADGSVVAADSGALRERFRSAADSTEQRIEWKRAWQGRWAGEEGNVRIELLPQELACRRVGQTGDVDDPCKPLSLSLECNAIDVVLDERPPSVESSWVCEPTASAGEEVLTPFPWVFGMHRHVVARDAGTTQEPTRRYQLEPPPEDGR
jgi:hypothetical protein